MNNAKLSESVDVEDKVIDRTPVLRQKEKEILAIIESIRIINESPAWKTLRNHLFDGLVESFDRKLRSEKNHDNLMYIQGQQNMAERFADFGKLTDVYRTELINIRKQING